MRKTVKRGTKKLPEVGFGMFDFVSVSLAAGSGHLDMNTYAHYLGAMHPKKRRKARRKGSK